MNNKVGISQLFQQWLLKIIKIYRFAFLFILMFIFFIVKAASPDGYFTIITNITFLLLVIYCLSVIDREQKFLWIIIFIIGAIGIISAGLTFIVQNIYIHLIYQLTSSGFYAVMFYGCLYYTLQDKVVSVTSLFGSLCAYLFMGMIFASLYQLLYLFNINAFTGISPDNRDDFIYFSFITLTTLGFGDICPNSDLSKTLAWMEAYLGQAYLTILMALLVGRFLTQNQKDSR